MTIDTHIGDDLPCDKCGKLVFYGDECVYSDDFMEVYHPDCAPKEVS